MANQKPGNLWQKTFWFIALWFGGVVVVAVGAEGLKFLIFGHSH